MFSKILESPGARTGSTNSLISFTFYLSLITSLRNSYKPISDLCYFPSKLIRKLHSNMINNHAKCPLFKTLHNSKSTPPIISDGGWTVERCLRDIIGVFFRALSRHRILWANSIVAWTARNFPEVIIHYRRNGVVVCASPRKKKCYCCHCVALLLLRP